MSEVTAVPLQPSSRRMLVILWIGIAALILAGAYAAWAGTATWSASAKGTAIKGTPEQYLAWHARQPGVVTTASGLQYQLLVPGKGGAHPAATDMVLVGYEGRLRDGTVFDKNARTPLALDGVIPGWTEGVQLMTKGAKYRFWLPPALAYGAGGSGDGTIPPDADLVFDITLIDFIPAAVLRQQIMQQQQQQGAAAAPPGQ